MHPIVQQQISALFNGRSHIAPVECGPSLGWTEQTVYYHQCKNDFPIRQVLIGGRRKVSINDYVDFVMHGPNANPHDPFLVVKPGRGRPSNKAKAAAARKLDTEKPDTAAKQKRGRPSHKAVAARKQAAKAFNSLVCTFHEVEVA
jgi:hypothetical protein